MTESQKSVTDLITGLLEDIFVLSLAQIEVSAVPQQPCQTQIVVFEPAAVSVTAVLSICAALAIVGLIIALIYFYFRDNLGQLPREIVWPYSIYKTSFWGWKWNGKGNNGFYWRDFHEGSEYFDWALSLFEKANRGQSKIKFETITAVWK